MPTEPPTTATIAIEQIRHERKGQGNFLASFFRMKKIIVIFAVGFNNNIVKKLKIVLFVLVLLALLGIVALHAFPAFEEWLHKATGWY